MSDKAKGPAGAAEALGATIERNAEAVRRGRREKGFLKRLGLALPVTVDDVKQAFYARARETHPDHSGSAAEFKEVQRAFDEAVEFAKRNGKRLPWIGAQLPIYIAQQTILELVEQWGGTAEVTHLDWLADTVGGDFAQLADRITQIDLSDLPIGDREVEQLTDEHEGLQYVETLLLANTDVGDAGALRLTRAANLRRVDLRGTEVSFGLRQKLARLPGMERVEGASRWGELFGRR